MYAIILSTLMMKMATNNVENSNASIARVASGETVFRSLHRPGRRQKGISTATLRRAQNLLGVINRPGGYQGDWLLELPRVVQNSPELLTPESDQLYRV